MTLRFASPPRFAPTACGNSRRSTPGGMFTGILGCLLDGDWTSPKIEDLYITPDRCILARESGQVSHKQFIGAEVDLIRNIHEVAELDGDELGYLLGTIAEAKRL
jgi:hypothetical protein